MVLVYEVSQKSRIKVNVYAFLCIVLHVFLSVWGPEYDPVNKNCSIRGPENDPVIKNGSRMKGDRYFIYLINLEKLHRVSLAFMRQFSLTGSCPGPPIEQFLLTGVMLRTPSKT